MKNHWMNERHEREKKNTYHSMVIVGGTYNDCVFTDCLIADASLVNCKATNCEFNNASFTVSFVHTYPNKNGDVWSIDTNYDISNYTYFSDGFQWDTEFKWETHVTV